MHYNISLLALQSGSDFGRAWTNCCFLPCSRRRSVHFQGAKALALCVPCSLLRFSLQGMGEKKEDELKLGFTLDALNGPNPFATQAAVHQDVADALKWLADRSPQQVGKQREQIMKKLEAEAKALRYVFISSFSGMHRLYCAL